MAAATGAVILGTAAQASHVMGQVLGSDRNEEAYDEPSAVKDGGGTKELAVVPDGTTSTRTEPIITRPRGKSAYRPYNYVKVGGKMPKNISKPPLGPELTEQWFTDMFIFRGYLPAEGKVVSMDKKRIGEGQGEFGDLYAIELTKVENAPPQFPRFLIAKICPIGKSAGEKIGLQLIYRNEAHFYNDFTVEGGGLPRPECYHVGADLSGLQPKMIFIIANGFGDNVGGTTFSPKNDPAKLYS